MNKTILLLPLIIFYLADMANGQNKDTLVHYYQYRNGGQQRVTSPDSCDFFRVIVTKPIPGSKLYSVTDYFKDGKVKLVGKSKRDLIDNGPGTVLFQESCVSFYNNGKRQSIVNYVDGFKVGLDYEYYPDGKLYSICKYTHNPQEQIKTYYIECHKKDGSVTCKDGNGTWILYNNDYDIVEMEGSVNNSLREGDWRGEAAIYSDTVKYTYSYHNNRLGKSIGYDKYGKAYPFTRVVTYPFYANEGPIGWVKKFNKNFIRPRNDKGKKMNVDTIRLSFMLGIDANLSEFKPIGELDQVLFNALSDAFQKCSSGWDPKRFFGVPFKTKIVVGIKISDIYYGNIHEISVRYDEYTLANNNYP